MVGYAITALESGAYEGNWYKDDLVVFSTPPMETRTDARIALAEWAADNDNDLENVDLVERLLEAAGYLRHHRASTHGYHSRKRFSLEPYKGHFGEGYKIHEPRFDTNKYHRVIYYIKEEQS